MTKTTRGFKILKHYKNGPQAVYLFKINGTKYMVSVQYFFLSLMIKKQNREFLEEENALTFFNKVVGKISWV